jgi:Cu-Zn family superoxide dismutase
MHSTDPRDAPRRRSPSLLLFTVAAVVAVTACDGGGYRAPEQARELADAVTGGDAADQSAGAPRRGRAVLSPASGSDVRGQVNFVEKDGAMQVAASVRGLDPGRHGLHIHETGDCSAPDATSAGGHFAPDGDPHGAPDSAPESHHVGDLGNLSADRQGVAQLSLTDRELAFDGENGVAGRAVIVHAQPDDMETQPSGAAGPRVACGVVAMIDGDGSGDRM